MDKRIRYSSTSHDCVFFEIKAHISASEAKGILLKKGYLQIDSPLTGEVVAKKFFQDNPNSIVRLSFISKVLGIEQYQRSIKKGDCDFIKEQILEKRFAFTFTGNPSLVALQPGDMVIVRKNTVSN